VREQHTPSREAFIRHTIRQKFYFFKDDFMTDCNQVNWFLAFVKIMPTLIIGLIAAYIAWKQWETARAKLNLDLFARRLEVFDKTWGAASSLSQNHSPVYPPVVFTNLLPEASFLFGAEVEEYMRLLVDKMNRLAIIYQARNDNTDFNNELKNEILELENWINNAARQGVRDIFSPYLSFGEWH
jgi:hypothetical protein